MKEIDAIIIHCSATQEGENFTAKDVDRWHRERGFKSIGYNYVILLDGIIERGRVDNIPGAHCPGYNDHSIGVCYIGGLDKNGRSKDTRTPAQKKALNHLIQELCNRYPIIEVLGHRDTSPDLNGNGIIEKWEWIKECPCFDVRDEFETFLKPIIIKS